MPSRPLSNQSRAPPVPPPHTARSQKHWAAVPPRATHFASLNPALLLCKSVLRTLLSE